MAKRYRPHWYLRIPILLAVDIELLGVLGAKAKEVAVTIGQKPLYDFANKVEIGDAHMPP